MTYSKEFLETTIRVWQPHYKVPLTLEDAREIAENASGLMNKKYGPPAK